MKQAGLAVELLETRDVRDAFKAKRGIAQLMRLGWFRPVHCKAIGAQEQRAVLTARKLVQSKLKDIENSLRGIFCAVSASRSAPRRSEALRLGSGNWRRATPS